MKPERLPVIVGWVLTLVVTAFLLLDVTFDLRQIPWAIEANAGLGIPHDVVTAIGITGLYSTLLYVFPPTALLGAILLSGFLGGAVAIHLRIHGSLFDIGENILIGVAAWSSLWLRDARLRRMLPIRWS